MLVEREGPIDPVAEFLKRTRQSLARREKSMGGVPKGGKKQTPANKEISLRRRAIRQNREDVIPQCGK